MGVEPGAALRGMRWHEIAPLLDIYYDAHNPEGREAAARKEADAIDVERFDSYGNLIETVKYVPRLE